MRYMRKGNIRLFEEDGQLYQFYAPGFNARFVSYCREKGISKGDMAETLAEELGRSADGIRKWRSGENGPSDLQVIRDAAKRLQTDWKNFVQKVGGQPMTTVLTERQKDAAKRIYDVLVWFLDEFNRTDGFHHGPDLAQEDSRFERVTRMEERVRLVLDQEYFDLHDEPIYAQLCAFAYEDMEDMYAGELGEEWDLDEVWQRYEKAMHRLNQMVEEYM